MKLKVCGMKYVENIQQVADLQPDYLGFIFYDKSKRNFDGIIPELPKSIKKTGVFVNATIDEVASKVNKYNLKAVQLHGDESVQYIEELRSLDCARDDISIEIIKVFSIKDEFDFNMLQPYIEVVDYFLFDTKGKERGGNGITFDWKVLENYLFEKPFFLSGGIGLDQVKEIKQVAKTNLPIYALDVNSKFELKAGLKSVENINKFKKIVITNKVK
ncbi:MAG: phosphoribosylanthranilate isomerase [Polaribacter sp.]|nr:phosphoribosylanthranilate isomerase [Polaribacter sp.]MDG1811369.1 phosphoribosylanthranilate isomerase [Polaribacter sp.]MDG1994204.1 phosphoribosylanthranilate isomerase [Polaribacter sp.]